LNSKAVILQWTVPASKQKLHVASSKTRSSANQVLALEPQLQLPQPAPFLQAVELKPVLETSSSTETELPQGGRHEKTELPAKVEALEKPKELSANSWGPVPEAHELYTNERYEAEG
jgi:hypothetical protein